MHSILITVPAPVYQRLTQRAARTNRPVEEEAAEALCGLVSTDDVLPADVVAVLDAMTRQGDDELRRAARSRLTPEEADELGQLNAKGKRERLDEAEARRAEELVQRYERAMLVRSQAAALLKQRGHDISGLLQWP
jgi:plasmid stability protein